MNGTLEDAAVCDILQNSWWEIQRSRFDQFEMPALGDMQRSGLSMSPQPSAENHWRT